MAALACSSFLSAIMCILTIFSGSTWWKLRGNQLNASPNPKGLEVDTLHVALRSQCFRQRLWPSSRRGRGVRSRVLFGPTMFLVSSPTTEPIERENRMAHTRFSPSKRCGERGRENVLGLDGLVADQHSLINSPTRSISTLHVRSGLHCSRISGLWFGPPVQRPRLQAVPCLSPTETPYQQDFRCNPPRPAGHVSLTLVRTSSASIREGRGVCFEINIL